MARVIELIVSATGETVLETKGYSGAECKEASRFLEQALGIASAERATAEFYSAAEAEQPARH